MVGIKSECRHSDVVLCNNVSGAVMKIRKFKDISISQQSNMLLEHHIVIISFVASGTCSLLKFLGGNKRDCRFW